MFMDDGAHKNVLTKELPFQTNHGSKGIGKEIRNLEHKSYDYVDTCKLAQILSKICALCKVRGHVLLKFGNK
jgi:hypothetical protein